MISKNYKNGEEMKFKKKLIKMKKHLSEIYKLADFSLCINGHCYKYFVYSADLFHKWGFT